MNNRERSLSHSINGVLSIDYNWFEELPMLWVILDEELRIVAVNQLTCNLLQVTQFDVIGKHLEHLFVKQNIKSNSFYLNSSKDLCSQSSVSIYTSKDQSNTIVNWNTQTLRQQESYQYMLLGQVIDDRDKILEKLVKRNELLINVLDSFPDMMYWKDKDFHYQGANNAVKDFLGLARKEDIIGKTDYDLIQNDFLGRARQVRKIDRDVYNKGVTGLSSIEEFPVQNAEGQSVYLLNQKAPLKDADGNVLGVVGLSIDITKKKQEESQLIAEKEHAEAANKAKSHFLAVMSHELRTPMNAIMGMAQILQSKDLTEKQRVDFLQAIVDSGKDLLGLINDTLEYSSIEAGDVAAEQRLFNIKSCIDSLILKMGLKCESKGLELVVKFIGALPDGVLSDERYFRQILTNLIDNAIKYTDVGVINLTIRSAKLSTTEYQFDISVQDTGIGIPKEKLSQIFNKFTQVHTDNTHTYVRKYEGVGLGLSIVDKLTELLGGKISVSSQVGKGSKFTFSIKLSASNFADEVQSVVQSMKNAKVLLVDDNLERAQICGQFLKKHHIDVAASSGLAAMAILQQPAVSAAQYKIVVVSNNLNRIRAVELVNNIKNSKRINRLLLIGHVDEEQTAPGKLEAFKKSVDCLVRRAGAKELLVDIGRHWQQFLERQSQAITDSRTGERHVLLVEDNELNKTVAFIMLKDLGCHVEFAETGAEALRKLKRHFDLVLMDVGLPDMTGLEVTMQFRQYEKNNNLTPTPIIALTAHAMEGDQDMCISAGMDDYLVKPILEQHLVEVLGRWV